MLSAIVWTNEGTATSDTDGFNAAYKANAALARQIVREAISEWEGVIRNFNYRNATTDGSIPGGGTRADNTFYLTISAVDLPTGLKGQGLISGNIDLFGKPYAGNIRLDIDADKAGWYFDPYPSDHGEFTEIGVNRYIASQPSVPGLGRPADFYRTVLHEIGHCVGMADDTGLRTRRFLTNRGIDQVEVSAGITAPTRLKLFSAGGIQATFSGAHLYEGPADPAFPSDPVHPGDLMNPGRGVIGAPTTRQLISELDVRILQAAYGYSVTYPTESFLITYDAANQAIGIHADPQVANNDIQVTTLDIDGNLAITINGTRFTHPRAAHIEIVGNNGDDTIQADDLPSDSSVSIYGHGGMDVITFGSSLTSLRDLHSTVFVDGGNDLGDLIVIDDSSAPSQVNRVFNIMPSRIETNSGTSFRLDHTGVEMVRIDAGAGNNLAQVFGTRSDVTTWLDDFATVNVGAPWTEGPINISNLGTNDFSGRSTNVIVSDVSSTSPKTVNLDGLQLTGLSPAPIGFFLGQIGTLTVNGGQADNVYNIGDASFVEHLILKTGLENDTVNLGAFGRLDRMAPTTTVYGRGGVDTLNLSDRAATQGRYLEVQPTRISGGRLGPGPVVNYLDIEAVNISLGDHQDSAKVAGLMATTDLSLLMGGDDDAVLIGDRLSDIGNQIVVDGESGDDALGLDDRRTLTDESFAFMPDYVFSSHGPLIWYAGMESMLLWAGAGHDWIGLGLGPDDPTLAVDGGAGSNTLAGDSVANRFEITGRNSGNVNDRTTFQNVQNLYGADQDDTFAVFQAGSLDGFIDAGPGINTLDYSAHLTGVVVNLALDSAEKIGGVVWNIQNVTGGMGDDILIGNQGGHVLMGGPGRDVLTAGTSASILIGGDDEDLLIGGSTYYDGDTDALTAIRDLWRRRDLDYITRVAMLVSGEDVPILDQYSIVANGGMNELLGNEGLDCYFSMVDDLASTDLEFGEEFIGLF